MRGLVALSTLLVAALVGCAPRERATPANVARAWQASQPAARTGDGTQGEPTPSAPASRDLTVPVPEASSPDRPIATINGRPVARRRVIDVLLRSKGAGLLEQLIVLDAAERLAAQRDLYVTAADVDREYDRALRRLVDPLTNVTPDTFDQERAERVLDAVLLRRNLSREEYLIGVRRNAYLRRIVESQRIYSEEELRREFDRIYGLRVQVRHIQLATPAEVARVQERLAAGEDFSAVARRHSANTASAREGGLLEPFSAQDEQVPRPLREVAFGLEPGAVSGAVRIGDWYHFVQVVAPVPPEAVEFEQVRDEVQQSLRNRAAEPAMRELNETLFKEADIRIHDPILHEAFQRRFADRLREVGG